jgi:hypothetical protein
LDVRATKGMGIKMKMQVEVFIIVSKTLGEVQKSINKYIGKGYQLQGAVTPVYKDGEVSYLATMVKEV